jgi:DNA mismatch endonuclease, patch repair protein
VTTSEGRRRNMRAIRSRDTKPELAVRALLHAQGLRYRVDLAPLKGVRRRADIVFTRQKIAVFIDGCFWHYCPVHGRDAASNTEYWGPKLRRNVERDRETDTLLRQQGWVVLRFWEHEEPEAVADAISTSVSDRRGSMG